MTEVFKNLTVDLSRKGGTRPIFAVEKDTGSRKLKIKITDDGSPYKLEVGTVAILNYKRSDGVSGALLAGLEENEVLVALTSTVLGVPGQVICSVSLSDENKNKITSSEFCLDVSEELYSGEELDDEPEYGLLLDTFARLSEIEKEESVRVTAEKARETAEIERESARESFENSVNATLTAQNQRLDEQDATINTRLSAQDNTISDKFEEQDTTIRSRLDEQDAKFAAQDAKLAGRIGDSGSVTLAASKWSSNNEQTVTIEGLREEDMVIFYPFTANDREICGIHGVFISPVSDGNSFTVTARATAKGDISLKYYVIRGRLPEEVG